MTKEGISVGVKSEETKYLNIYEVLDQMVIPDFDNKELKELFDRAYRTRLGFEDVTDDEITKIKECLNVPQYYKIGVHPCEMQKAFSGIFTNGEEDSNKEVDTYYVFHIIPPIELNYKGFPIELDLYAINDKKMWIPWG